MTEHQEEKSESTLRINWWSLIIVFIMICGFFFMAILNHEGRLTKAEANTTYIVKSLDELKVTAKDNNDLIRRHIERDKK
jgi:hypothetical protein